MNEQSEFHLLNLRYWPFALVPSRDIPLVWADRSELRRTIDRLSRTLKRRGAPTLHLLWADFGAGKTHTLRFIEQEAKAGRYPGISPIYTALPKGCRYFLDIYRAILRSIGSTNLANAHAAASNKASANKFQSEWPELWTAFKILDIGNENQKAIAWNWLTATPGLSHKEVTSVSLHGRIVSTEYAVLALKGIVSLLALASENRVLLMIDEFQRVETLREGDRNEINAGLHSFYNEAGTALSIVLSFSFGVEENIKHFLNKELLDRVDPVRLSIPALTSEDGVQFLRDVIISATENSEKPFAKESVIAAVVNTVAKEADPTPRRLLKTMGHIANEAMADIEDGIIEKITVDYVNKIASTLPRDFLADAEE